MKNSVWSFLGIDLHDRGIVIPESPSVKEVFCDDGKMFLKTPKVIVGLGL